MNILKKIAPHLIAVVLFIALASIYFSPLFDGNNLKQGDVKQFQGMAKEITDYRIANDADPLWTNSMFGGMPAYQIAVNHDNNFLNHIDKILKLGLPTPIGILFITMLGFYILGLCLRINPWLSILGALAFGFSSFNILYIGAGHMTKVNAVAYMAPALGGLILAFRGKMIFGAILFALFFGLNLSANHLQITYYLILLLGAVAIGEVIRMAIEKKFVDLGKTIGALIVAGVLGVLPSTSNLLTTYEYSKYTTRGATDLTIEPDGKKKDVTTQKGLNKDYILEYNYAPGEFLSVAIPNAKGGKDDYIANNEAIMDKMESDYADQVAQSSQYWGGQRFSGGAIYMGAIMVGLFLLGLVFVKDSIRWPFFVLGLLIVFLVGKDNAVNDFFLNNFPMYNKFRDSKMILVVLQVIVPAIAILFLNGLFSITTDEKINENSKGFTLKSEGKMIFGVCAGLSEYYGIDKNIFRAIMLALTFLFGWGIIIYLSFWLLTPKEKNEEIQSSIFLIGDKKWWFIGFSSVALIFAFLFMFPSITGSFIKDSEIKQFNEAIASTKDQAQIPMINGIKADLIKTRMEIYQADAGRTFLFFIIGSLLIFAMFKNKMNSMILYGSLGVLVLFDQMSVCKRYLNNEEGDMGYESYEGKQEAGLAYTPDKADLTILDKEKKSIPNFASLSSSFGSKMKDYYLYKDIEDITSLNKIAEFGTLGLNSDYRVFNFNNPFNETSTSYFHKSIGGYHGAKLKRYQEMIDFYIGEEMQTVNRLISQVKMQKLSGLDSLKIDSQEKAKAVFDTISIAGMALPDSTPILNMLNTKYIILDKTKAPIENNQANGNAWFVSKSIIASNANEEMKSMKGFDSKNTLVINRKENSSVISSLNKSTKTAEDKITLTKYETNSLTYQSNSKSSLPAVFSEIWYPEGWNCYIDGKKTDKIFRANYILRGAIIPAGKHKIEWKFEPTSYQSGSTASLVGSILLIVLFAGATLKESNLLKKDA